MAPPTFLENIVILCIESRFSEQNSVIRLTSNILAPPNICPPPNFWAGYATDQSKYATVQPCWYYPYVLFTSVTYLCLCFI